MIRQTHRPHPFEDAPIPVRARLAAAWTSVMFLYIYVDYLVLHKPGHIDGILAGKVWEFAISQTFLTLAFVSMAIPSCMILLSISLPAAVSRVINLIVATLFIPYSIFNAAGETWTMFFGLSIGLEVLLLGFILRVSWTWPRLAAPRTAATPSAEPLPAKAQP